jgi:carbohydrate-binding DOMON domain-containing protein
MYWGVPSRREKARSQQQQFTNSKNKKQNKRTLNKPLFFLKVSNVYVTSDSASVTCIPYTITRMQIVTLHRTTSGNFLVITHAP